MSAADLDALLAAEAAENADRARGGDPEAGECLVHCLLRDALKALGKRLRFDPVGPAEVLALLGLVPRRGRRPKAGPGSRAEAARRLRVLVDLARQAGAPEPLLAFYSSAAEHIEAGAVPLRALGLKRRRGRPPEGEVTRVILDALSDEERRKAVAEGADHDSALDAAGKRRAALKGRVLNPDVDATSTGRRVVGRSKKKIGD